MGGKAWSEDRADAVIRRIACALITDGADEEGIELVRRLRYPGPQSEVVFCNILREALDWGDEEIAPRLAEVYVEAPHAADPMVCIDIAPRDEGDEMSLLSEIRKELKRMAKSGKKTSELQFCSGAVRITREGFDGR